MSAGTPQIVGGTPRKTSFTCIAIADASPIIAGVTFQVVKNDDAITGAGGTEKYEGQGVWSYLPSQAEIDTEGTLIVIPVSSGMIQINSLCPVNPSQLHDMYAAAPKATVTFGDSTTQFEDSSHTDTSHFITQSITCVAASNMLNLGQTRIVAAGSTGNVIVLDEPMAATIAVGDRWVIGPGYDPGAV
jgi:hypothetical protein